MHSAASIDPSLPATILYSMRHTGYGERGRVAARMVVVHRVVSSEHAWKYSVSIACIEEHAVLSFYCAGIETR
jgi:hypothetical protein